MDINSLLEACKKAQNLSTDGDLAKALGVSKQAMSGYRNQARLPDPVVCAAIAGLSGVPLARVLGVVGEARAISREEKAVWRKLAATAMTTLCALGVVLPAPGKASDRMSVYSAAFVDSAHCILCKRRTRLPEAVLAANPPRQVLGRGLPQTPLTPIRHQVLSARNHRNGSRAPDSSRGSAPVSSLGRVAWPFRWLRVRRG